MNQSIIDFICVSGEALRYAVILILVDRVRVALPSLELGGKENEQLSQPQISDSSLASHNSNIRRIVLVLDKLGSATD